MMKVRDVSSTKPLSGKGVLVTRAAGQAKSMVRALQELGATVYSIPSIVITPIPNPYGLTEALNSLASFDNLVFTSTNGVEIFLRHLASAGLDPASAPPALCVGPRTLEAWISAGGSASALPEEFTGAGLTAMLGGDLAGRSFLILRPREVRTEIGLLLRERGARASEVVLYETLPNREGSERLRALLDEGRLDVVTFTSPSAVSGAVAMAGEARDLMSIPCLCIGTTTAEAALRAGFTRVRHPEEFTVQAMIRLIPSLLEEGDKRR